MENTKTTPQAPEIKDLTLEEATKFFAEFYDGAHHIPGFKPKQYGPGFSVKHDRGDLGTYDFNELTRLVLMAHRDCIRVSVAPAGPRALTIAIWKRQRSGGQSYSHPTIAEAIERFDMNIWT